ncbi:hypothetical protein EDD15DRAFT_2197325 [Pisolithus albus]|nr:hypothetical protein EDD15DRAFT_2197325 [Pisolithus albus]
MAESCHNPHEAVQPDFAAAEHAQQRQFLIDSGLSENQAVIILTNLWTSTNDREKAAWDAQQAERTRAQLEAERAQQEENERRLRAEEELRETAHNEERKKYKNKFAPIVDAPLPIGPVHIPSRIALTHIKKGEYVEMWYFTNKGIRAAEASSTRSSKNNNSFVFVHDEDADTATLVPAASVSDSCSTALIEDVDLSWEDFMQATPRMIESMELNDWPQDRINMFIEFWSNLENHPWRHSDDIFSQKALLRLDKT